MICTVALLTVATIHIIATVRLHVGIFMVCCLAVLSWLLPRRAAVSLTMLILVGYCIACGGHPAVFRATVVAELCLVAWLLGRLPDPMTCLSLAAAVMVFLEPNALLDTGFQFTFATMSVILLILPYCVKHEESGRKESLFSGTYRHVRSIFALSAAAHLGSWPLTAFYFNLVSYIGFFANLLIVPLLILIIPLALATAILSHLFPIGAILPGLLLQHLLHLLLWIAHRFAAQSWTWKYVDNVRCSQIVMYYALLGLGVGWLRTRSSPFAHLSSPD